MATLNFRYRPAAQRDASVDPLASRMSGSAGENDASEAKRDRWWYESSYDLRSGLEVDDSIGQTLPGDELDQLFRR